MNIASLQTQDTDESNTLATTITSLNLQNGIHTPVDKSKNDCVKFPNSGRWSFLFGNLSTRELLKYSSNQLDGYPTRHFALVCNDIWFPATKDSKSCILVNSQSGSHVNILWLPNRIGTPNAVVAIQEQKTSQREITISQGRNKIDSDETTCPKSNLSKDKTENDEHESETEEVAMLASTNGLHSLSKDGQVLQTLHKESYADLCIFMDNIYALDYKTKTVNTFRKFENSWQIIRQLEFKYTSSSHVFDSRNSIQAVKDGLFIYTIDTERLHKYSTEGVKLEEHGEEQLGGGVACFYGGRLCGYDDKWSVLICDAGNQRLQVRSSSGLWQAVTLDTRPKYAVCLDDHSFMVLDDNNLLHCYKLHLKQN